MYEFNFAERLSSLREQKGVSAREMSLAIGQNKNYINLIERGKSLPSMQAFFYICDYLQISPKDFFDFNVEAPKKLNDLMPQLSKLSQSQLEIIESLIEKFT